jgi:hypothetical protein
MTLHKEDHRIGITPILLRRAAYYLTLGEGVYLPEHPHFDKVVVDKIYDLKQNPINENEWGLGLKVAFYQGNHCVRWVEFSCRTVGVGGDEIIKKAET